MRPRTLLSLAAAMLVVVALVAGPYASAQGKSKKSKNADQSQSQTTSPNSKQESAPATQVDLNTASEKDLEGLPGVGSATAKRSFRGGRTARLTILSEPAFRQGRSKRSDRT
jgi:hypothetical protein